MNSTSSRQRPRPGSSLKRFTTRLLPLLLLTSLSPRAQAAPTSLAIGPAFNGGSPAALPMQVMEEGAYLARQGDGKLVVAGYKWVDTHNEVALARYHSDGTLDAGFGTGGTVTTPVAFTGGAITVAVQGDGKLVAAGWGNDSTANIALVRYNSDGSLDGGFGSGGTLTTLIGPTTAHAAALALQSDGKLVVAGEVNDGITSDFALARYNSDGTLDGSFGSGGKVITDFGPSNDRAYALVLQGDGKLVAGGQRMDAGFTFDFALARYLSDGSLDGSFGSGGKVVTPIGAGEDRARALALQSNGKLVLAGWSHNGSNNDFALVRYAADGGVEAIWLGDAAHPVAASAMVIEPDGNIVAADSSSLVRYIATAQPASHLRVTAPAIATAGTAVNVTVTALDLFDKVDTAYSGTVHFASSDGAALLPADATLTLGTGTFPVTFKSSGNQSITATDTVTAAIAGTSGNVAVSASAATHFSVTAPATATAGTAVNLTVTALDAFNNVDTAYAGAVHFTSSDAAAVLPADATLSSGTGSFPVTFKSVGNQSVTATDTVTASITGTSGSIAVSAGAATHFTVTAPATATAGTPVNLTVTAFDAFNNVDTAYAGTVHFTSSDGAALLPADATLSSGTGSFPVTFKSAGNQSVTATDTVTAAITGTSGNVAVSAGAATHFSVTAPATAMAGTAVNVTVTALDGFNNVATAYAGTVHFTSSDGAALLPANATLTSGTGSFPVTFNTAGNQSVTATDTVTAAITGTSGPVTVAATAVPLLAPAALGALGLGLFGLGAGRLRRKAA